MSPGGNLPACSNSVLWKRRISISLGGQLDIFAQNTLGLDKKKPGELGRRKKRALKTATCRVQRKGKRVGYYPHPLGVQAREEKDKCTVNYNVRYVHRRMYVFTFLMNIRIFKPLGYAQIWRIIYIFLRRLSSTGFSGCQKEYYPANVTCFTGEAWHLGPLITCQITLTL